MSTKKKLFQAAAGSAGGAGLDVDEVFSTYLYTGDSTSPRTITNGIDLSGEGGLVWFKSRTTTTFHGLFDTERGATKRLRSDSTNAEDTLASDLTAFNSDGFTLGNGGTTNTSPREYASWTWRKAPKFFDVVTWTGNGVDGRAINHNLGSVPGMIIVKDYSNTGENWTVYHRGIDVNGDNAPETDGIYLNTTGAAGDESGFWNDTAPTSTQFTVGVNLNGSGGGGANYVAYLFAHNNSDGDFGPDADQDVIKCGSYTGNGSTSGPEINLGFEPQFVIVKRTDSSASWFIMDTMRGMFVGNGATGNTNYVNSNNSNAEDVFSNGSIDPTPTGFNADGTNTNINASSGNYIYMAIRRGPLAEPQSATDVFAVDNGNSSDSDPTFISNFPVDMAIRKLTTGSSGFISSRLTWQLLNTDNTNAEGTGSTLAFDNMDGYEDFAAASTQYSWMWKRAPSYFDAVAYTGNGTAGHTVSHNLGVAPEMMWVKRRDATDIWVVYNETVGNTGFLRLNGTNAVTTSTVAWNDTSPTATDFTLGTYAAVNTSGSTYIAYLFATLAGISKVGSYTGNGGTQNIDCGFSSGARFVLIKRTDVSEGWKVHDSVRGIVAGNDPFVELNNTNAENSSFDLLDPYSGGFAVNNFYGWNGSGGSYIFYAIA